VATSRYQRLVDRLKDAFYRRAFLAEHLQRSLPMQIRAMREQRGWTQAELAKRCGKSQAWICKVESPDYGRFSLQTLVDVAAGFDVAFTARFVPYSELLDWYTKRSHAAIPSFSDDAELFTPSNGEDLNGQVIVSPQIVGPSELKSRFSLTRELTRDRIAA
jgi:transcriptional regulator with XRE-family HTH domain